MRYASHCGMMSLPLYFLVVCYSLVSARETPSLRSGVITADTTVSSSFLLLHGTAVADNIVVWCSDHHAESPCGTTLGTRSGASPPRSFPSLAIARSVSSLGRKRPRSPLVGALSTTRFRTAPSLPRFCFLSSAVEALFGSANDVRPHSGGRVPPLPPSFGRWLALSPCGLPAGWVTLRYSGHNNMFCCGECPPWLHQPTIVTTF